MIRDITIGQYYPAKSPIHKLDPRTKLAGTLIFIISVFLFHTVVREYRPGVSVSRRQHFRARSGMKETEVSMMRRHMYVSVRNWHQSMPKTLRQ